MLNVLGHYTPLLAKTGNRALVLARDSVVELLQALEEWRPVRVECLDRETRLDRIPGEENSMANLDGVAQQLENPDEITTQPEAKEKKLRPELEGFIDRVLVPILVARYIRQLKEGKLPGATGAGAESKTTLPKP
jgi:hypothetical protein